MIHLPLRAKIALWSALAAVLALAAALVGIHFFLRVELLELIDLRMEREQRELFWDLDRLDGGPLENRIEITEDHMPPSMGSRLIELLDKEGKPRFRSQNLGTATLVADATEPRNVVVNGEEFRAGTYYHKFHTLNLGYPLQNYHATLQRVTWAIILVVPGVTLAAILGGCWVAARALRPVRKITASAEEITAEGLHRRLPVPEAKDEIHQLTAVLNDVFSRLEKSYNQAMQFASDASHQLKTPITVMRAAIESVLHDPTLKPEHASALSDLLQQTRRLSSLTEGLLLLARADAGRLAVRLQPVDLVQVIQGCSEDAEILADRFGIGIETDLPDTLPALADTMRTEQILLNLLENAVKYNETGGTIRVRGETDALGTSITVCNTGKAIPKDKAPFIFERFVRGEANEGRAGHGLGLALARELARAQGGDLTLVRSDDKWTEFELRLRTPNRTPKMEPPVTSAADH
jgi:signal transduction histidine kinase